MVHYNWESSGFNSKALFSEDVRTQIIYKIQGNIYNVVLLAI